ncbi:MAG: ribokinase [Oscillospiraceae bacterium]|nr:ribokinase [Oscillospiraceae bacterium]
MNKIAVIGMAGNSAFMSVEKFHTAGETVAASAIHFEPGGKGFNQAVAAARFGAKVSFFCAVGTEYKQDIEDFLIRDGITPVLVQKPEPTAFATILTDAEGANQVTVYQGPKLSAADLEAFESHIREADILLLNNEVPMAVNEKALNLAKESDTYVIWNPAPSVPIPEDLIRMTDLFTPNEHEREGLSSARDVIVTLGAKGCLLQLEGETLPAVKQENVVDTTGAGDTFNGVLAACLSRGDSRISAVKTAMAAAGLSVTRKYAATAIPYASEVKKD